MAVKFCSLQSVSPKQNHLTAGSLLLIQPWREEVGGIYRTSLAFHLLLKPSGQGVKVQQVILPLSAWPFIHKKTISTPQNLVINYFGYFLGWIKPQPPTLKYGPNFISSLLYMLTKSSRRLSTHLWHSLSRWLVSHLCTKCPFTLYWKYTFI